MENSPWNYDFLSKNIFLTKLLTESAIDLLQCDLYFSSQFLTCFGCDNQCLSQKGRSKKNLPSQETFDKA